MSPFHAKLGYTRSIDKYCLKSTKVSYLGVHDNETFNENKIIIILIILTH